MGKNKLTVRKVIKNVVKSTGNGGIAIIECGRISVSFDFYAIEEGKCCIITSNGLEDFIDKLLEMEVYKYALENNSYHNVINDTESCVAIKIKAMSFAEKYIL